MRDTLVSWLPEDLRGAPVLDAGTLAMELGARGAGPGRVRFAIGDTLDPAHGRFDYVVAMDSLIPYEGADIARTLGALADRTRQSVVFTVAPRTLPLMMMWTVGKSFPRGDRAPAIAPISQPARERALNQQQARLRLTRAHRVSRGFYISQAVEAVAK